MKKIYKLEDLECANCAAKMEQAIAKIDGVISANVNFLTQKLTIEAEEGDMDGIVKQAAKICKKIEPDCRIVF